MEKGEQVAHQTFQPWNRATQFDLFYIYAGVPHKKKKTYKFYSFLKHSKDFLVQTNHLMIRLFGDLIPTILPWGKSQKEPPVPQMLFSPLIQETYAN